MATHSSILAWRILWTEKPGELQSVRSQRVGRDGVAKHSNDLRNKVIKHRSAAHSEDLFSFFSSQCWASP